MFSLKSLNKSLLDSQPHNQHNTTNFRRNIFRSLTVVVLALKRHIVLPHRPCSCLSAHHSSLHIKVKHTRSRGFSLFQHGYCLTQLRSVYIMAASRGGGMGREGGYFQHSGRESRTSFVLFTWVYRERQKWAKTCPNQRSISCLCALKKAKPVYMLLRVNMIHAEVRTG